MVSSKTISANGERKYFSKGIHIINRETLTVNFIYMYNTKQQFRFSNCMCMYYFSVIYTPL